MAVIATWAAKPVTAPPRVAAPLVTGRGHGPVIAPWKRKPPLVSGCVRHGAQTASTCVLREDASTLAAVIVIGADVVAEVEQAAAANATARDWVTSTPLLDVLRLALASVGSSPRSSLNVGGARD